MQAGTFVRFSKKKKKILIRFQCKNVSIMCRFVLCRWIEWRTVKEPDGQTWRSEYSLFTIILRDAIRKGREGNSLGGRAVNSFVSEHGATLGCHKPSSESSGSI